MILTIIYYFFTKKRGLLSSCRVQYITIIVCATQTSNRFIIISNFLPAGQSYSQLPSWSFISKFKHTKAYIACKSKCSAIYIWRSCFISVNLFESQVSQWLPLKMIIIISINMSIITNFSKYFNTSIIQNW